MGADFSRVRLDPLLDFAGLELKQGAVLLDADANELMAVLDRRLRSLASDTLGRATVSATTPDAFRLTLAGGSLEIGKGRLYVDGLLAENHGFNDPSKRLFDELMAETVFTDKLTYATQPYLPASVQPKLPTAGRHLVYLDVWQRELTHLERPDLVELALGVETSSRLQTVWQVRVLDSDAGAGASCNSPDADLAGWSAVIAPSTGVLTTGSFDAAVVTDPCDLPPTGGFRGLENQLYRVEIHSAGQPGGTATFKWSRENASVGSRVASMVSGNELELESLGRDDVLRFNTGDWVEIIDDPREFSQAPGEMRRITVTEATRRISFAPALPAPMLPPGFPNSDWPSQRNLRVRRWDHKGKVYRTDPSGTPVQIQDLDAAGSSGVIAVPAAGAAVLLEDGVTVSFATTGPTGFRSGDWWAFAARTADASVEKLDRAPPRGVHHHYARLGIWDVGAQSVTDCRTLWPPKGGEVHDCGCTACVTVESQESGSFTIQDAVNQVRETGGTICLGPGRYALKEPVVLKQAKSLRIVGKGPATLLVAPAGGFVIQDSVAIAIEDLAIISLNRNTSIDVSTCIGLGLNRLVIAVLADDNSQLPAVTLHGVVGAARFAQNAIFAPVAVAGGSLTKEGGDGGFLLTAAVAIEDNILLCQRSAIAFSDDVLHLFSTRIERNDIIGCADLAIDAQGLALPGASLSIAGNSFNLNANGIRCAAAGLWIERNRLRNWSPGDHVAIKLLPGLDRKGKAAAQILANQIDGFGEAGISIAAAAQDLIVKLNAIDDCGAGIVLTGAAQAAAVSIENNHLRNIGPATERDGGSVVGIAVTRADSATIAGNAIRAIGAQAVKSELRAGILTFGVNRARVSGNEIAEIAPAKGFVGTSAGIMLRGPQTQLEVSHNSVQRDAELVDSESAGNWFALTTAEVNPKTPFVQAGDKFTIRLGDGRILALGADYAFVAASLARNDAEGARASIMGNLLSARGLAPAVLVVAGAECLFNDNRVETRGNRNLSVVIESAVAIISSNRVRDGEASIRLTAARSVVVIGNITTGPIIIPGGIANTPWAPLNVIG
jgi:hypothetical protein